MRIFFASDHAGFALKNDLLDYVKGLGHEVLDKGPLSFDPDDDYPDFIQLVAREVSKDPEHARGIILGGGGQGEAIVANRFPHVRAAVFYGPIPPKSIIDISGKESSDPFESARLARSHNDANVLSIGARFISLEDAQKAVRVFLETPFSGEERHIRRVKKIDTVGK
ncbi:MAG TPA: RpiB/LacA/LacB family sugar-phosphate isomerase [Candidatus Paceibacterota bacterium]